MDDKATYGDVVRIFWAIFSHFGVWILELAGFDLKFRFSMSISFPETPSKVTWLEICSEANRCEICSDMLEKTTIKQDVYLGYLLLGNIRQ